MRRGISKYFQLRKVSLTKVVTKDIENASVKDDLKVYRHEALKGVFGTVRIEPLKQII